MSSVVPYGGVTGTGEMRLLLRRILVLWRKAPPGWIPPSQA
jgi:hypothetical protein